MNGDASASKSDASSEKEAVNHPPAGSPDSKINLSTPKQISGTNSELETIDSEEEVIDNDDEDRERTDSANVSGEGRTKGRICYNCRLLFNDEDSRIEHEKSENHEMVKLGFKPSVGVLYCYLCWDGFKDSIGLSAHFASVTHEENVARYKVKAVCLPEEEKDEGLSSKKPRLDFPDVVPYTSSRSDLGVVRRLNRDEWICEDCNAVFVTYLNAKVHSKSPNHLAVIERQYPPINGLLKNAEGYYCFVCWYGCETVAQIASHNSTDRHFRLMKNTGVARLFREDRLVTLDVTDNSPKSRDDADNFIVLDEVKGSGGEGDGAINDTLDEVSSDEEALEKVESAPTAGLGLEDLEDVDSEEEKIDELVDVGLGDVTGLEDVDSSEDELITEKAVSPQLGKDFDKLPKAPPPPIISKNGLRSNRSNHSLRHQQHESFEQARESFNKDSIDNLKPVPATISRESSQTST